MKVLSPLIYLYLLVNFSSCSLFWGVSQQDREQFSQAVDFQRNGELFLAAELFTELCERRDLAAACLFSEPPQTSWEVDEQRLERLSIMQGPSGHQSAFFNILLSESDELSFIFIDALSGEIVGAENITSKRRDLGEEGETLQQFFVTGLSPSRRYRLLVLEKQAELIDVRDFFALSARGDMARFAVVSHFSQMRAQEGENLWPSVYAQRPDFIALTSIGQEKYLKARGSQQLFFWPRLVPIFASWGEASESRTTSSREHSMTAYENFFLPEDFRAEFEQHVGLNFHSSGSFRLGFRSQSFYFLSLKNEDEFESFLEWPVFEQRTIPAWILGTHQLIERESLNRVLSHRVTIMNFVSHPVFDDPGAMELYSGTQGYEFSFYGPSSYPSTTPEIKSATPEGGLRLAQAKAANYLFIRSKAGREGLELEVRGVEAIDREERSELFRRVLSLP